MANANIVAAVNACFRWLLLLLLVCFSGIVVAPNPSDVTCGSGGGALFEAAKSLFFSANSKYHQIKTSTEQMINHYASKAADAKIAGKDRDLATSQQVVFVLFAYLDILKVIYPNVRVQYDQSLTQLSSARAARDQAKKHQEDYRERTAEYHQLFKAYDVAKADKEWHEALMARIKKDRQFIQDTIDGRSNLEEMYFKIRTRNAKCDYKDAYIRLYDQKRTLWAKKTAAKIKRYENAKPLDSIRLLSESTDEHTQQILPGFSESSASSSSQSSPKYSVPSQSIRNSFKYRDTSHLYGGGSGGINEEIEEIGKSRETTADGKDKTTATRMSIRTNQLAEQNRDPMKGSIRPNTNLDIKNEGEESSKKVTIGKPVFGVEPPTRTTDTTSGSIRPTAAQQKGTSGSIRIPTSESAPSSSSTLPIGSIRTVAPAAGSLRTIEESYGGGGRSGRIRDIEASFRGAVPEGSIRVPEASSAVGGGGSGSIRVVSDPPLYGKTPTMPDASILGVPEKKSGSIRTTGDGDDDRTTQRSNRGSKSIRPDQSSTIGGSGGGDGTVPSGSIRLTAAPGSGGVPSGSIRPGTTPGSGGVPSGSIRPGATPSGSIRTIAEGGGGGNRKSSRPGDITIIDGREVPYESARDAFEKEGSSKKDDYSFRFQLPGNADKSNDDDILANFKSANPASGGTGVTKQGSIRP